jgi:hypothetical protein
VADLFPGILVVPSRLDFDTKNLIKHLRTHRRNLAGTRLTAFLHR